MSDWNRKDKPLYVDNVVITVSTGLAVISNIATVEAWYCLYKYFSIILKSCKCH